MSTTIVFGYTYITIGRAYSRVPADRFRLAYMVRSPFGVRYWLSLWVA